MDSKNLFCFRGFMFKGMVHHFWEYMLSHVLAELDKKINTTPLKKSIDLTLDVNQGGFPKTHGLLGAVIQMPCHGNS